MSAIYVIQQLAEYSDKKYVWGLFDSNRIIYTLCICKEIAIYILIYCKGGDTRGAGGASPPLFKVREQSSPSFKVREQSPQLLVKAIDRTHTPNHD